MIPTHLIPFVTSSYFSAVSVAFTGVSQVIELEKLLAAGGTPADIRLKIAKPAATATEEVAAPVDIAATEVAVEGAVVTEEVAPVAIETA